MATTRDCKEKEKSFHENFAYFAQKKYSHLYAFRSLARNLAKTFGI